jgi:hypothetical protein
LNQHYGAGVAVPHLGEHVGPVEQSVHRVRREGADVRGQLLEQHLLGVVEVGGICGRPVDAVAPEHHSREVAGRLEYGHVAAHTVHGRGPEEVGPVGELLVDHPAVVDIAGRSPVLASASMPLGVASSFQANDPYPIYLSHG